ncbi:MAG: indolepyruvate oxidoreductase subunit beta [Chitinispirillaceae bacterium]|nr:indolepyruvate oxidoreductase subunit beta [Chitinispirillaceae bacterium]
MRCDIILAGVGGQGVVSSATILSRCAMYDGFFVRQSEVHGMAQRGGAVQAQVRIADCLIESDLVPAGSADCIISMEPIEGLRHLSMLAESGFYITSLDPVINIIDYPEPQFIQERLDRIPGHIAVRAEEIAQRAGSAYAANIVLIGVASAFLNQLAAATFERVIGEMFERKGERTVEVNLKAFGAGRRIGEGSENGTASI